MVVDGFALFTNNCDTANQLLVSVVQEVVIVAQVSPIDTFEAFASVVVGFAVFVIMLSELDAYWLEDSFFVLVSILEVLDHFLLLFLHLY